MMESPSAKKCACRDSSLGAVGILDDIESLGKPLPRPSHWLDWSSKGWAVEGRAVEHVDFV